MDIIKNLASLIKVKTIITMVVIAVFAYLAFTGEITPDNVMIVVSTVIAFYFGTQAIKEQPMNVRFLCECSYKIWGKVK